ncbi:MAG TPA: hypothetical protein IGS53_05615 [Leptolyngbyaceae cyanobacterium M33_DOE_097]|uniref:Uncharacterized protein n=1 Tax=Oscillatoriales cyanobacterium SpSt-418 TaxID=2282169 RepID=A0A7C3PLK8_9CYAN|nr:hypothetical protein [Leptolyngbyaceae cyanobacterium M33_DOE_097]
MLKLTYTDVGLHLERVPTPLEATVALRVILAMRTGSSLYAEPGRASFLLPADLPELNHLKAALSLEPSQTIEIDRVDQDYVEISLSGYWLANNVDAHEGMFVTVLSTRAEYFVAQLWEATQMRVSSTLSG